MTNTITILAISTILVSVTFIPLAEGAIGWNGFLKEIGFGGSQVYEVSVNGIILEGELSTQIELLCLDGDWLNDIDRNDRETGFFLEGDDTLISSIEGVLARSFEVFENPTSRFFPQKAIGYRLDVQYFLMGQITVAPFDIPFTVTTLCLSPSPLTSGGTVGGEWQGTDTVALFIGYSVLNAYWLAPTLAGLGAGIYLTKNKWKR